MMNPLSRKSHTRHCTFSMSDTICILPVICLLRRRKGLLETSPSRDRSYPSRNPQKEILEVKNFPTGHTAVVKKFRKHLQLLKKFSLCSWWDGKKKLCERKDVTAHAKPQGQKKQIVMISSTSYLITVAGDTNDMPP